MSQKTLKIESSEISEKIQRQADYIQCLFLSDTRSYRLLMVIYQSIIEMALTSRQRKNGAASMEFLAWFIQLGNSLGAESGLMFLHQGLNSNILSNNAGAGFCPDDPRLGQILMAYIGLTNEHAEDISAKRFHALLQKGWCECTDEDYKDSLHRALMATIGMHSKSELDVMKAAFNSVSSGNPPAN
jgi:hypothetical protein